MSTGKVEGLITVPAGGWEAELVEWGGASGTVTLQAAKTYYHSSAGNDTVDLAAALKAALEAVGNATYTVTASAGEGGTGRYVISAAGAGVGSFAITFTDTALRDLLGFTGNLSGALTYTSEGAAQGLWLPAGAQIRPRPSGDAGKYESDARALVTRAGHTGTLAGFTRRVLPISWEGVRQARILQVGEAYANESLESFWLDCIQGQAAWAAPGGPLRLYWDADVDGTYATYRVRGRALEELPVEQMTTRVLALWTASLELVKVP